MEQDETFTIKARRCKRCGGLLFSADSIRDGYGHSCKMKMRREAQRREEEKNQYSLFPPEEDPDNG